MEAPNKIFPTAAIAKLDQYTVEKEPITSLDLMERAAVRWVEKLLELFPLQLSYAVVTGNGNNGGDGFAIARLLQERKREVVVFHAGGEHLSPDCRINKKRWRGICHTVTKADDFIPREGAVVIDALLGTGLNRPVAGELALLIRKINRMQNKVVAVDMPSGLMGEDNSGNDRQTIIRADVTLTFQFPKLAFMFPENELFVGQWYVLDIGLNRTILVETNTPYYELNVDFIRSLLPQPSVYTHKGMNGHGLLIAGAFQMMGAAVLAAKAAVRSGIGLLSCHVPGEGGCIMQTAVPEAILDADVSPVCFTMFNNLQAYTAIGVGPGIGKKSETVAGLENLLRTWRGSTVLDADALNILAQKPVLLNLLHDKCILTPHPKEFERLAGKTENDFERLNKLSNFATQYQVYILLKGAHTILATPEGKCYFNTTGNPGMAKGGMGDVLTGILLALLSNGLTAFEAAAIGVFAHGLAGDILAKKVGKRGICAGEVAETMGSAWKILEKE